jgi:hypothetical protein
MPRIKCFMVELNGDGFRNCETGEVYATHGALPPGAMYYAWEGWRPEDAGPDGRHLMVITPGGEWWVDGRANNCTRPGEPHKCWVRHGEPPEVTVDKEGDTCGCGCSIGIYNPDGSFRYHGFLRNGWLEDA